MNPLSSKAFATSVAWTSFSLASLLAETTNSCLRRGAKGISYGGTTLLFR